jgi:hypothetical protein
VRDDLGEHPGLAHAAGDQLGVLGTEVDHQDRTRGCGVLSCHPLSLVVRSPSAQPAELTGVIGR